MQPPMIETLRKRLTDREHPARLHLIGVAGSGMSGLALMLMEMGHRVSGCDRVTSAETERLQSLGLSFSCPHSADAVSDAEIVIYSSAIRADNPALAAARKLNIPCMRRAECLAAILNGKKGVVVSGTHGKTTTSALCAHLMREGRMRPCHYVGAEIPVLGTNAHCCAGEPRCRPSSSCSLPLVDGTGGVGGPSPIAPRFSSPFPGVGTTGGGR